MSGPAVRNYWALAPDELPALLGSDRRGLSSLEAERRLADGGPNDADDGAGHTRFDLLLRQVRSPLLLLLVFAALVAIAVGEWVDAALVLVIVAASAGLGWQREFRAETAARALQSRVQARATVLRDGGAVTILPRELVPGDVVLLRAGSLVPADLALLAATDLLVNEAMLTGESFPASKAPGQSPSDAPLNRRSNVLYMGTNVRSGTGQGLVVATGRATEFGAIAHALRQRAPVAEFDRGLRRFGMLLTHSMTVVLTLVLVVNLLLGRPLAETLLFAVALAVGLSPELLPAILSVNLARASRELAAHGVLVRRLDAVENLGSMDTLCTDKTGTLTEGVVRVDGAWDAAGQPAPRVLELAATNAALQAGLANPLDEALLGAHQPTRVAAEKLAELPYDFVRRRLGVVVRRERGALLIVKGAFESVLGACTTNARDEPLDDAARDALRRRESDWTARGIRVLAVASRPLPLRATYGTADEAGLRFEGFVTFLDRQKDGVDAALAQLARLGVRVKVITGDSGRVARYVAGNVGLAVDRVVLGPDIDALDETALHHAVENTDVFAEVNPHHKERIVRALRRGGHVVGFLGDGINDAAAMHAADTSLSVQGAADVAREAADFVLLERHLDVIRQGVEAGRRTFANTLKYVLTTMSANLGNMISMALASLFLPFLPLLAGQILLNNLLSDLPAFALADDRVDDELVAGPRRWDLAFVRRFMLEFGLLSSAFDFLTFALLLRVFAGSTALFRTGWFMESLLTELAVALVVRTRRPFWRSRPSAPLVWSSAAVALVSIAIPYLPGSDAFGFAPLPAGVLAAVVLVAVAYVGAVELLKRSFYRRLREEG